MVAMWSTMAFRVESAGFVGMAVKEIAPTTSRTTASVYTRNASGFGLHTASVLYTALTYTDAISMQTQARTESKDSSWP